MLFLTKHFGSCCRYVLCGLFDRGAVQAWSVEDPEWACKIDENPAGIKACRCEHLGAC
jgi:hypothetical protein